MKKTFVVNYPTLNTGGIENSIHIYMRYALTQGYRVIWLCYPEKNIAESYKDILLGTECVRVNRPSSEDILIDKLELDGKVLILSYTPLFLSRALKLSLLYKSCNISNIYIVANTRGRFYYAEENFFWGINKWIAKKAGEYNRYWASLDYVRFYTKLQIDSFEKHYDFHYDDNERIIVPPVLSTQEIDIDALKKRIPRKEFNIVSITRFQFPHKQYLIGLIKDFGVLKAKYPHIKLHIVGYGPGISLVNSTIAELSDDARKDIILHGELGLDQIDELMKEMHLNISVAGSVGCGGRNGVLSLPARNFCESECEVYGYLPDSYSMTTATEPGKRAIDFIEEVINMSDAEYYHKCMDSYKPYAERKAKPDYLFEQSNSLPERLMVERAFNFYRRISFPGDVCFKIKKIFRAE